MREVLRKLMEPAEPPRRFGRVMAVLPDGRYTVEDEQQRKLTVDGDSGYLPGMAVVVKNDRITGRGKRDPVKKTYKV